MNRLVAFLASLSVALAFSDPECLNYDHSNYGCVGECITTGSCPASKYITNLCPTQANDIRCCFTADSDIECASYNHASYGEVGYCIDTSQCPSSNYISNLCPTKPGPVKCCFSHPTETCSGDGGTDPCNNDCGLVVKSRAQQILDHHDAGNIALTLAHQSGVGDGADAYSNIYDTAQGCAAQRSSYSCAQGSAPGGSVCLSQSVLDYLLDLADDGYYYVVNSLAGACHGKNSLHYSGLAVDLSNTASYSTFMEKCSSEGASESTGPGYPGSDSHTHCAFSS